MKKFYTPELYKIDNELQIEINFQGLFGDIPYKVGVVLSENKDLVFSCYYLSEEPSKNKDIKKAKDIILCYGTQTGRIYNIQVSSNVLLDKKHKDIEKIVVKLTKTQINEVKKVSKVQNRKTMNLNLGIEMLKKSIHKALV